MKNRASIKNKGNPHNVCLEVAKYFIAKAYEDGREMEMTNMKIQKLLYYAQSIYLALYDEPLFNNNLEAWRNGPVCPPVYRYYCKFESQQLPIPKVTEINQLTPEIKAVLDEVWWFFGEYHAYQLSDMSHIEFPWRKARAGLPSSAPSDNPIELAELKILGKEKLLEIEQQHPLYEEMIREVLQSEITEVENSVKLINANEIEDWLTSLAA